MTTIASTRTPDRTRRANPDTVDEPIVVMFDAQLAERLRDATRPLPVEPPRQERAPPHREAFQYD
jgi:hypothetical protein